MSIYYQEKVTGVGGATIISANRANLARFRVEAGTIQSFDVWRDNFSPGSPVTFQLRINGVAQFVTPPVLLTDSEHIGVTGLSFATADGDVVSIDASFEGSTEFGFRFPAYFRIGVEQEVPIGPSTLDSLTDVVITSPADGEILTYDNALSEWKNAAAPASVSALDDLTNVNAPAPSDGDVLTFDTGSGDWINAAPTGGGGGSATAVFSPDVPYVTPSTEDDEFDAGSLNGKWSTWNVLPQLAFPFDSHISVMENAGNTDFQGIYQALSPGANRDWVCKIRMPNTASGLTGGFMATSSSGIRYDFQVTDGTNGGAGTAYNETWTSNSSLFLQNNLGGVIESTENAFYMRIKYTHGSPNGTIQLYLSADGIEWRPMGSALTLSGTLVNVGLYGNTNSNSVPLYFDFFRRLQGGFLGGFIVGEQGIQGDPGADGADGLVVSVVAGTGVTVDDTDPANPIVNATGGSGGAGPFATRRTPDSDDDEFDGSSLAGAWAFNAGITQPSVVSYDDVIRSAVFVRCSVAQDYFINKTFTPGSGNFSMTLCGHVELKENYNILALHIADTGDTNWLECVAICSSSAPKFTYSKKVSGTGTFEIASHTYPTIGDATFAPEAIFLHLQRVSGTWSVYHSLDGINWRALTTSHSQSITVGQVQILLGTNNASGTVKLCGAIHWIRKNWITL